MPVAERSFSGQPCSPWGLWLPGSSPVSRAVSVCRPETPPGQATKGSRQGHGGLWAPRDSPGGPRPSPAVSQAALVPVEGEDCLGMALRGSHSQEVAELSLEHRSSGSEYHTPRSTLCDGRGGRGGYDSSKSMWRAGEGRWQGVGLSAGNQEQVTSRDPGSANKTSGQVGVVGWGVAAEASDALLGRGGEGCIREIEVQAGMQTVTS